MAHVLCIKCKSTCLQSFGSVLKNVHSHNEYFPFCVRCIQFRSFKYPFKLKIKLAAGFTGIPAWDNECKVLVQSILPCLIQTTHPVQNPNRWYVGHCTHTLEWKVTHHRATLTRSHMQDGWTDGDGVDAADHPLGIAGRGSWLTAAHASSI